MTDLKITIGGNTLSKISFCDKQCSNINDNKVKGAIVDLLEKKYNIQTISRDYNIINPNTLRIVSFHQHILTPFSNGNPYWLLLMKIDGINCCIYIDKKLKDGYTYPKMHCVKYRFQDQLFDEGTIFSGELVKDNERRWLFLIDNIVIYRGMSTSEKNIISKFELIHNILCNEYIQDKFLEICPLQIKKLFLYKDINKIITEFIPNLSYTCKGIIFYTLNNRCSNFAFLLPRDAPIEIKSPHEINDIVQSKFPALWAKKHKITKEPSSNDLLDNTIISDNVSVSVSVSDNFDNSNIGNDSIGVSIGISNVVFRILKTDMPDIYNLYSLDENSNLYKHGIALVPNIKLSHHLYNTFKSKPNTLDMAIECKFSKLFEKWTPIRFVTHIPYKKNIIEQLEEKLKNE
jgi:hypothetical protein